MLSPLEILNFCCDASFNRRRRPRRLQRRRAIQPDRVDCAPTPASHAGFRRRMAAWLGAIRHIIPRMRIPPDGFRKNKELTMNTNSRQERKAVEDAADTADTLSNKLAGKISDGLDEAARSASRFSQRLRNNGAHLQEELSAAGERFGQGAKRLGSVTSDQIRAHPWAAIGIAVAAGAIASRLLRRR